MYLHQHEFADRMGYYAVQADLNVPTDEKTIKRNKLFAAASGHHTFEKEVADDVTLDTISKEWWSSGKEHDYDCCAANCADFTQDFLDQFAEVPKARSCAMPISCDLVCCCLPLPSFFQCCTLPGRVLENTRYQTRAVEKATDTKDTSLLGLQQKSMR
ncbi:MAG: hypothetical protein A3E84_00235 [Gammaproteobacteria bacterium RIFCSPHIGHO2_12_FULL_42_13]|nr:MAG: hypothetical protein A3E84_00235 [Gammaproteobacteria bacterium RIFCSPHIGHO2_12_FULL_42_13]